MHGVISNIQRFTINDGPGIRVTVFMQGCPLNCWWCHNPENISFCNTEKNHSNKKYTPEELVDEICKDVIFIEESKGGVTFSGGEPFMQPEFLVKVLELCKIEGIHTAVDTTGLVSSEALDPMIHNIDLFLYDIKIVNSELHKKYTGASNSIILKNLIYLVEKNKELIIRLPLIPNITDTKQNLKEIQYLMTNLGLNRIDLLPYHRTAEGKYDKLGLKNKMKGVKSHSEEEIKKIKKFFLDADLDCKVGG